VVWVMGFPVVLSVRMHVMSCIGHRRYKSEAAKALVKRLHIAPEIG
jgi:hypothetical protein